MMLKYFTSILVLRCLIPIGVAAEQSLSTGSVLDIFPDSGVVADAGEASCSFEYSPSGSTWNPAVDESQVFLASFKTPDWQLGIGKGGHIYSLKGVYGESVPPQRQPSPWNDEVWQAVITSEGLIAPLQKYQNANPGVYKDTGPLMYFVHQAGIYVKGAGVEGSKTAAPFYSPCFRKRWNPKTRTLELVNWMQQAHTPCVWKSGVLIYTAYQDMGNGVIEVNQVLHNFGTERLDYLNTPWGGVRNSSLPNPIMSKPDGSWEAAEGLYGWENIPTRNLVDSGGWMAWTQDVEKETSPSLALVFGRDEGNISNGKRQDEAIRWGMAGSGPAAMVRDYEVAERMSHANVGPGESWSIRWYLVSGELAKVCDAANRLAKHSGVERIAFDNNVLQSIWHKNGAFQQTGEGDPWQRFIAFPVKDTVPVFLLKDKRSGKQIVTADPYALAETEPYPNPLPESYVGREVFNNRVIYRQYAPHIGYENLLGYAYTKKPDAGETKELTAPEGITLHDSAKSLWIVR